MLAIKLVKSKFMKFEDIGLYFLLPAYMSNWINIDLKLSKISQLIREYIRYVVYNLASKL